VTYVPGFTYDLFASFAHLDNRPSGPRPLWVSCFVRDLAICIQMLLGVRDGISIFFDGNGSLQAGGHLANDLIRSAQGTATFLAITSPAYLAKDSWGIKELEAFAKANCGGLRVFPVEFLPSINDYPPPLGQLKRLQFWRENNERVPIPLPRRSQAYCDGIFNLANQICCHLKEMRTAREALVPA
jgi:hypothetical protein